MGADPLYDPPAYVHRDAIHTVYPVEEAILFAAVGPAARGGEAATAIVAETTLYRAVSGGEIKDIALNGLRLGENSMGNKWFAESAANAAEWGKEFYRHDKQSVWMLEVKMPRSIAEQLQHSPRLDGFGPAWSASAEQLAAINSNSTIRVLMGNPMPRRF